jgi:hypothetical protein
MAQQSLSVGLQPKPAVIIKCEANTLTLHKTVVLGEVLPIVEVGNKQSMADCHILSSS